MSDHAMDAEQTTKLPPIAIGCADLPPGLSRRRYFSGLGFLEVSATFFQIPKSSVLQRWRDDAGSGGHLSLTAPQTITHRPGPKGYARGAGLAPAELAQAGGFRDTSIVRQAVQTLAEAAATVRAAAVLFRSGSDFTPSATNREVMHRFFQELATQELFGSTLRVWEPHGLWELQTAARLASELDVVVACDPLTKDPLSAGPEIFAHLPGETAYFRVTGLGHQQTRFDDYDIESLLAISELYKRAWVVFANVGKYPDALRMQRLVRSQSA